MKCLAFFYEWNRSCALQTRRKKNVFLCIDDAYNWCVSSLHSRFVRIPKPNQCTQTHIHFVRGGLLRLIDCDSSSVAFVIWQLINWRVSATIRKKMHILFERTVSLLSVCLPEGFSTNFPSFVISNRLYPVVIGYACRQSRSESTTDNKCYLHNRFFYTVRLAILSDCLSTDFYHTCQVRMY